MNARSGSFLQVVSPKMREVPSVWLSKGLQLGACAMYDVMYDVIVVSKLFVQRGHMDNSHYLNGIFRIIFSSQS